MASDETGPVEVGPDQEPEEEKSKIPSWLPILGVFLLLSGGVAWLLTGTDGGEAFVYSKTVDEVVGEPTAFADRELRVEGDLKQGSIQFREDPCEWRFVLTKGDDTMPVRFPQCVVPDTFRDGMGISVVVQGQINPDGSFLANQVVPRCPSKYEMKQKQQNGEEAPHDYGSPLQGAQAPSEQG